MQFIFAIGKRILEKSPVCIAALRIVAINQFIHAYASHASRINASRFTACEPAGYCSPAFVSRLPATAPRAPHCPASVRSARPTTRHRRFAARSPASLPCSSPMPLRSTAGGPSMIGDLVVLPPQLRRTIASPKREPRRRRRPMPAYRLTAPVPCARCPPHHATTPAASRAPS